MRSYFIRLAWLFGWLCSLAACQAQPAGQPGKTPAPDFSAYPWVYVRDGLPVEPGETVVEVAAVGDILLGRGVAGEADPLEKVVPWLRSAGLALGNLECALAPPGEQIAEDEETDVPGGPYPLIASASAADELSRAGFDLLGIANNHALDRGLSGLEATASHLTDLQIDVIGAGPSFAEAYQPLIREAGGLRIAFLAFNAVPSPRGPEWSGEVRNTTPSSSWSLAGWDRERATAAIEKARTAADAVVVSIHWGYEYETRVDPAQRDIAQTLITAGADLVVGHHPHVAQAIERIPIPNSPGREGLTAYSLGNFVFDQGAGETGQGLALRAFFDQEGLRAVQALPVKAGTRPSWISPEESEDLLERVAPQPEKQAWSCEKDQCYPAPAPLTGAGGFFSGGKSDLTGDGNAEEILLNDGRVYISGTGFPAWESPSEWWVIDLATGDPNHDGRQEALAVLQKSNHSGVLLSHPFVLGFRRGSLRTLWGGSAVSDPILEVELGDLDGDGWQELAVLEELHAGQGQAVSVWRWNGWGFSQIWRSLPGRYAYLRLAPAPDVAGSLLLVDQYGY